MTQNAIHKIVYCSKWKRFPTVDEKDATFFHLITVGYKDRDTYCCPNRSIHCIRDFKYQPMMGEEYSLEQKRTICGFRIQSLPLLIKTFQKQDNLIWEEVRSTHSGKKTRIDILNQENKYFVVLEKRKSGDVLLWTAFPVTRERISDLKRAYKAKKDPKAIYTLMVK